MASHHDLDKIRPWSVTTGEKRHTKKRKLNNQDLEYLQDIREALLSQSTPTSSVLLYLVIVFTVIGIVWAALFEVDEVTTTEAKVISSTREQVVTSLEGGVLDKMMVREGETVEKNQPVVQLQAIRFESQYDEVANKEASLRAAIARAKAEAYDMPLSFPSDLKSSQKFIENETKLYKERRQALKEYVDMQQNNLRLITKELEIAEKLADQGLYSLVEVSRLQRQANDLKNQIDERKNRYKTEASAEASKLNSELEQITSNKRGKLDLLQRTTLRAPVDGIVKNIRFNTRGAAVPATAPVLDIVPINDDLQFEAKLDPKEIAYIHPGQTVAIKLLAYDYTKYGELPGKIELISADTFKEEVRSAENPLMTYYKVLITVRAADATEKKMNLIPGMGAQASIMTGSKTVLQYILKPIYKAKDSFKER